MGLFGGGNSSSVQNDYVNNTDDRVGASDNATIVQTGGGAFTLSPTENNDNSDRSTKITTITNQTVDPGLLAAATQIAGIGTAGAVASTAMSTQLAETAINTSAASTQAAIKAASDANKSLSDTAALSIGAARDNLTSALSSVGSVTGRAFDFSSAIAGKSIDSLSTDNSRAFSFASDLFTQALGTITDSQHQTALQADNFISDFTSQLATANESQSERNFGRIQQLAVVAVIVIVVGLAVAKG